jgi:hypothetical protein
MAPEPLWQLARDQLRTMARDDILARMRNRLIIAAVWTVGVLQSCGGSRPPDDHGPVMPPYDAGANVHALLDAAPHPPSQTPANLSGNVGTWREVTAAPARSAAKLASHEEPAPGRYDSGGQIYGYCPPRARVFDLGSGRSLVTREPCSGVTEIMIRNGKQEQPVADSILYGVTGTWHLLPLDTHRVVMVSEGTTTNLQLVDLATARAQWVRLPSSLERSRGLRVAVAGGEIFLSGGSLELTVGSQGCENPPPNMGCDPVPITKQVPNPKVWALRPSN